MQSPASMRTRCKSEQPPDLVIILVKLVPLFLREQPAIIQADRTHSLKNRSDVTSGYNVFVWLGQYQDIYIYTPEIFKGFM